MGCATSVVPNSASSASSSSKDISDTNDVPSHAAAAATDAASSSSSKDPALNGTAASVADDPFAPPEIVLTDQHKKVIVKNWKILSTDLTGRGSRIFMLIFARNPLVKSLFTCGHLEGDALLADPNFKGHASRFMQAVGAVVDNLDNYREALAPLLNDLGRRHVYFKGFKPIYFNDFQESIMQVFAEDLGSKFNSFAREAWRLVFLFILTELKRGFTQCLREKGLLNQQLQQQQDEAAATAAAEAAAAGGDCCEASPPADRDPPSDVLNATHKNNNNNNNNCSTATVATDVTTTTTTTTTCPQTSDITTTGVGWNCDVMTVAAQSGGFGDDFCSGINSDVAKTSNINGTVFEAFRTG